MKTLALSLALAAGMLLPLVAAAPALVDVQPTPGRTLTVPAGADPTYSADPGVHETGQITLLRVGATEVNAPTFGADPSYSADPGVTYQTVTVPGASVLVYAPVWVSAYRTGAGTPSDSWRLEVGVDSDVDGEFERPLPPVGTCYCPMVEDAPYPLVWGTVFRSLPSATAGGYLPTVTLP